MSIDPQGHNPYSAPAAPLYPDQTYQPAPDVSKPGGPWTMNYLGAIDMIHRRPDWFVNMLLILVCAIIPVIGSIVVKGYMYEVVEVLHRTGGTYYPRLDFNRFVDYLLRGVGPFLVQLAFGVVIVVLMLFGYAIIIASAFGAAAVGDGHEAAAGLGILAVVAVVGFLFFCTSLVANFLLLPMALRGGLSCDIGQSFNFTWAIDFMKKTWVEMLLVFLFQFLAALVAELAVAATCGLGLLVVVGYMLLLFAWLQFNLYRVYLSRGGEPIPFKPLPLPLVG
jgi:hypothetical protein